MNEYEGAYRFELGDWFDVVFVVVLGHAAPTLGRLDSYPKHKLILQFCFLTITTALCLLIAVVIVSFAIKNTTDDSWILLG